LMLDDARAELQSKLACAIISPYRELELL
jgi:hypothetical protein